MAIDGRLSSLGSTEDSQEMSSCSEELFADLVDRAEGPRLQAHISVVFLLFVAYFLFAALLEDLQTCTKYQRHHFRKMLLVASKKLWPM